MKNFYELIEKDEYDLDYHIGYKFKIRLLIAFCSVFVLFVISTFYVYIKTKQRRKKSDQQMLGNTTNQNKKPVNKKYKKIKIKKKISFNAKH